MKLRLPGRRPEPEATPDPGSDLTAQLSAAGKGRPTPKRSEAQGRRTGPPPPPPTTRKEAYRRMRETQGATRGGAGGRGGERAMPARDQGPVRKLVRDIVDSRRNVGSIFLFVAALLLVSVVVPNESIKGYASLVWFFFFLLIVADSIVLGRRIKKIVNERFPKHPESNRSLMWYGINRTTLPRRWRFPKATVGANEEF